MSGTPAKGRGAGANAAAAASSSSAAAAAQSKSSLNRPIYLNRPLNRLWDSSQKRWHVPIAAYVHERLDSDWVRAHPQITTVFEQSVSSHFKDMLSKLEHELSSKDEIAHFVRINDPMATFAENSNKRQHAADPKQGSFTENVLHIEPQLELVDGKPNTKITLDQQLKVAMAQLIRLSLVTERDDVGRSGQRLCRLVYELFEAAVTNKSPLWEKAATQFEVSDKDATMPGKKLAHFLGLDRENLTSVDVSAYVPVIVFLPGYLFTNNSNHANATGAFHFADYDMLRVAFPWILPVFFTAPTMSEQRRQNIKISFANQSHVHSLRYKPTLARDTAHSMEHNDQPDEQAVDEEKDPADGGVDALTEFGLEVEKTSGYMRFLQKRAETLELETSLQSYRNNQDVIIRMRAFLSHHCGASDRHHSQSRLRRFDEVVPKTANEVSIGEQNLHNAIKNARQHRRALAAMNRFFVSGFAHVAQHTAAAAAPLVPTYLADATPMHRPRRSNTNQRSYKEVSDDEDEEDDNYAHSAESGEDDYAASDEDDEKQVFRQRSYAGELAPLVKLMQSIRSNVLAALSRGGVWSHEVRALWADTIYLHAIAYLNKNCPHMWQPSYVSRFAKTMASALSSKAAVNLFGGNEGVRLNALIELEKDIDPGSFYSKNDEVRTQIFNFLSKQQLSTPTIHAFTLLLSQYLDEKEEKLAASASSAAASSAAASSAAAAAAGAGDNHEAREERFLMRLTTAMQQLRYVFPTDDAMEALSWAYLIETDSANARAFLAHNLDYTSKESSLDDFRETHVFKPKELLRLRGKNDSLQQTIEAYKRWLETHSNESLAASAVAPRISQHKSDTLSVDQLKQEIFKGLSLIVSWDDAVRNMVSAILFRATANETGMALSVKKRAAKWESWQKKLAHFPELRVKLFTLVKKPTPNKDHRVAVVRNMFQPPKKLSEQLMRVPRELQTIFAAIMFVKWNKFLKLAQARVKLSLEQLQLWQNGETWVDLSQLFLKPGDNNHLQRLFTVIIKHIDESEGNMKRIFDTQPKDYVITVAGFSWKMLFDIFVRGNVAELTRYITAMSGSNVVAAASHTSVRPVVPSYVPAASPALSPDKTLKRKNLQESDYSSSSDDDEPLLSTRDTRPRKAPRLDVSDPRHDTAEIFAEGDPRAARLQAIRTQAEVAAAARIRHEQSIENGNKFQLLLDTEPVESAMSNGQRVRGKAESHPTLSTQMLARLKARGLLQ